MKRFIFYTIMILALARPVLSAEFQYPFTGMVNSSQVNVRAGQSQNFEDLTQLQAGEKVVVVNREYSWYKIKLPSHASSYVHANYIERLGKDIGMVTANNLNVRARPEMQSSVIGRLKKGTLVRMANETGEWIQIEPDDQSYGWVAYEFIDFHRQEIPPPRSVESPSRSSARRKKVEVRPATRLHPVAKPTPQVPLTVESPSATPVTATGILQGLGAQALTQNIRHQLVIDGKPAYYLKGYRTIMDSFLNYKVNIEGRLMPDIQAPHPVILVTKIRLVL